MLVKDLIAVLSKCDGKQPVYIEAGFGSNDIFTIYNVIVNNCGRVLIQGDGYIAEDDRTATMFDFDIPQKSLM